MANAWKLAQRDDCKADRQFSNETRTQLEALASQVGELSENLAAAQKTIESLEARISGLDNDLSDAESRLVVRVEEIEGTLENTDSSSKKDSSDALGGYVRPSERKRNRVAALSNPQAIIERGRGEKKEQEQ